MLISCFCLLAAGCFNKAYGQAAELAFQHYTITNGLCDNNIQAITQDNRGFIWIGTKEGLSRFDGNRFRNYYASDDSARSFPNNNIRAIIPYRANNLLVLSGNRLWRMDCVDNRFYPTPFSSEDMLNVSRRPDGMLILSCPGYVFIADTTLTIRKKIRNPFPEVYTNAAALGNDSIMITVGPRNYLYGISSGRFTAYRPDRELDAKNKIASFGGYKASSRILLLQNFWGGLFEFDMAGKLIKHYRPGHEVSTGDIKAIILDAANDEIYVATTLGLNIINRETGKTALLMHSDKEPSIASDIVTAVFIDKNRNIWTGTDKGLTRISGKRPGIRHVYRSGSNGFNGYSIRINRGEGEYLYANFYGGGTYKVNTRTCDFWPVDTSLMKYPWRSALHNNTLLTSGAGRTRDGRAVLFTACTSGKVQPLAELKPFYGAADLGTMVYKDSHGDVWYSLNYNGGLIRQDSATGRLEQFNTHTQRRFILGYAADVVEDSYGNLWFSNNKGSEVCCWDYKKQTFHTIDMDTVAGLRGVTLGGVMNLHADKKGTLWISMEGVGLTAYDIAANTARRYTIEDGLLSNYIYAIVTDAKGRVWAGTAKGLVCFIPEEKKFINFSTVNGLPGNELSSSAILYDETSGNIWLGYEASLIKIDPEALLGQMHTGIAVYFDEILLNGKKISLHHPVSVPYNKNNFQFSFTAVDIENGNALEYAYRMTGADNDWISSGENHSAIYSSLHPGNYTFNVKVKHRGNNKWTAVTAPFHFTIQTPWWETWWFRLLIAGAAVALIALVTWYYFRRKLRRQQQELQKQQAVERERTRIATDMHDDFGASLSRIKFLSEKIQQQKPGTGNLDTDLRKISRYSDEMSEKMGEIVWALNERYDSAGDLISFCRSYAAEYLGQHSIRTGFVIDVNDEKKLNGEVRRNLFLCLKEALHNVVKHAGANKVQITFRQDEHDFCLVVQDDGKGMDMTQVGPFSNGLDNMRKRMAGVGGKMNYINNGGMEITFLVPVR